MAAARWVVKAPLLVVRLTREFAVKGATLSCVPRWPSLAALSGDGGVYDSSGASSSDSGQDRDDADMVREEDDDAARDGGGHGGRRERRREEGGLCTCGLSPMAVLLPWPWAGSPGKAADADMESSESLREMGPPSVQRLEVAAHADTQHWRAYSPWERFWAPFLLNTTNGGILVSLAWCVPRGLLLEAFAYAFLLIASVALHIYRDWPHFPGRRHHPDPWWTDVVMRIDYAAAFNLCGAVWVYQTDYGSATSVLLTQPALYAATLALSVALAVFNSDKLAANGAIMTAFGAAVGLPYMLLHASDVVWPIFAAVFLIQNAGFAFLLYWQYRLPYWIAHSLWHVLGSIGSFLMLLVRPVPPPATTVTIAHFLATLA